MHLHLGRRTVACLAGPARLALGLLGPIAAADASISPVTPTVAVTTPAQGAASHRAP